MNYRVIWSHRAQIQFYDAATWWAEHRSKEQAERWIIGFSKAIEGLASNPESHEVALENDAFPQTIRQLLYGLGRKPTHRAIYTIESEVVKVLAIHHVSQESLSPEDT